MKVDGEVKPSPMKKLEGLLGIRRMYDSIQEGLKEHDQQLICVFCDHLEEVVETGLVKK